MKLKKIFENNSFIIWEDNKGYDFSYDIENKTNNKIIIELCNYEEQHKIDDWIGLFNNQEYIIEEILNGNYKVVEENE